MIETSGRSILKSRQACAVESAARRSGLPVHIILTSSILNLEDNTTCQLYKSDLKIYFYTVDYETFIIGLPLETNTTSLFDLAETSEFAAPHKADILRIMVLYKF